MTLRKLKEAMVKSGASPLEGIDRMTDRTIFRETCPGMVWLCGCNEILPVTINAVNPEDIKPHKAF
jgi:hypothetical protein